jgi:HEAT repeat protein
MRRAFLAVLVALASCSGQEADVKSRDPYERYLGVKELADQRDAAAMAEVVRLLDDPNFLVTVGSLEVLALIGHKEFLQHAVPRLKHNHPMVRAQACTTIAAIRNEEGLPPLAEALKDPDGSVKRAAVKALQMFGNRPETVRALVEAVGDKDPGVSLLAHEALQAMTGRLDVARARDAWGQALR